MARGPLHPGLRFLMDIPTPQLKILVEDFAREFNVDLPDEVHFRAWERLNAGHGQGWVAICAYNYFDALYQHGMEFMTYVYAKYGRGLPPGARPSLITRVRSLWSEDAKFDLSAQVGIYERLRCIRDSVHNQMFGTAQSPRFRQGV